MSNNKDSIKISNHKTNDNNINEIISNELLERVENDNISRIKISEESVKRAEENSKLSIRISESRIKESNKNKKLNLKIIELENKINLLSFGRKKESQSKFNNFKIDTSEELSILKKINVSSPINSATDDNIKFDDLNLMNINNIGPYDTSSFIQNMDPPNYFQKKNDNNFDQDAIINDILDKQKFNDNDL